MNVIIPENKSEILLKDFLELIEYKDLVEEEFNKKILELIYKIPKEQINKMIPKDYFELIEAFNKAVQVESKFKQFIMIDNKEYGFIPKFEDLKAGDLIDLDNFLKDGDYINILAILYRPVISKDKKGRYLVDMKSEVNSELFEDIDYETYEGCIGFFLTLLNQLEVITLKYMEKQMKHLKKNPKVKEQVLEIQTKITSIKNGMLIQDYYGS